MASMELRHLRYFVMAAEEENISRASSRLNVSQPAVSRQIRDLEDELGVTLFERDHNGLHLTDAGATVLWHAREVLQQVNALTDSLLPFATHQKPVSLKIGYIATALAGFLKEGLRQFNCEHKSVCIQIFEMSPRQQETALREGEIDLAFLGNPSPEVKRDFQTKPIRKVPMAAIVAEDHPLAKRKSIDFTELAGDPFLSLHEKHFPGRPELIKELFKRTGIPLKVALKVNGLSEILGLVAAGSGVAVVPADLAEFPHAGIVFLTLKRPKISLFSSAAWREDGETPELRALLELIQLKNNLLTKP